MDVRVLDCWSEGAGTFTCRVLVDDYQVTVDGNKAGKLKARVRGPCPNKKEVGRAAIRAVEERELGRGSR